MFSQHILLCGPRAGLDGSDGHCHKVGARFLSLVAESPSAGSKPNLLQNRSEEVVRGWESWSGEGVCRGAQWQLLELRVYIKAKIKRDSVSTLELCMKVFILYQIKESLLLFVSQGQDSVRGSR